MEMPINLSHLKYFVDAVEAASLIGAAKRNHVTHSTISQGIKRLEGSLGVQLLLHKKRRFALTADGERLLKPCVSILQSVGNLRQACQSPGEVSGKLSFASSHSILSAGVLKAGLAMKRKYGGISLNFEIGRTQEIKEMILTRRVEFGITIDDGKLLDLNRVILKTGKFILVSSGSISGGGEIPGFVLTRPRPETAVLAVAYRKKFKKELPILHEVDSWNLVKEVVKSGEGIGLVPDFALSGERGLKKLPWHLPVAYDLVVIHRLHEPLSRAGGIFIELLKEKLMI